MNTYEEQQERNTPEEEEQIDAVAREILSTYHPAFEELAK